MGKMAKGEEGEYCHLLHGPRDQMVVNILTENMKKDNIIMIKGIMC